MPLERDEGEYAYAGQLILQGVPPYKEAYNMKLPGTYAAYALIMLPFGQSPAAIHIGLAFVNAASIILLFLIGRKILDAVAGVTAAAAFAILALSPTMFGLAGHATHFVVLAALAGIWLLLIACQTNRSLLYLCSGLLFGLSYLMKQHGAFFGLFALFYLLWTGLLDWLEDGNTQTPANLASSAKGTGGLAAGERRQFLRPPRTLRQRIAARPFPWRILLIKFTAFGIGLALPYALTCLSLWSAGVFHEFVFWTISYARQYASSVPLARVPDVLRLMLKIVVGPNLVLWLLPCIGALLMWWDNRLNSRHRFFMAALTLCSLASVSVGFYFREHYFILLLPAMALLIGIAVSRATHVLWHNRTIELFWGVPILGLSFIALAAALIGNGPVWFSQAPAQIVHESYGTTLFSDAATEAASYINAHTSKDSRIAVLGSEPEIYFYSRRRSATGYLYTYPLMEDQPLAARMQDEMIAEIERAKPEYVIYVEDLLSWMPQIKSERKIFAWWKQYWAANLDLVKVINIEGEKEASVSGGAATTEPPCLLLLKRKSAAPANEALKP
jgi:hypothetical protein